MNQEEYQSVEDVYVHVNGGVLESCRQSLTELGIDMQDMELYINTMVLGGDMNNARLMAIQEKTKSVDKAAQVLALDNELNRVEIE